MRSEKRKMMKSRAKDQKADRSAAMGLFLRMQMMPVLKRWRLACDLMWQSDLRRAAKNSGQSFRAFRKLHGICQ